jgi:hypothetical protein
VLRLLALPDRLGVVHVLNRLDPLLGIGDGGLLAPNLVVDGGELLVETGGAKDDHVFTRLAVVLALVFLVVVVVLKGKDNVPGSDEVDILVVTTGAEVEAALSLAEIGMPRVAVYGSRAVKVGSDNGTGSKNLLLACLITRDSRIYHFKKNQALQLRNI